MIRFERCIEKAGFFSPLAGMEFAEHEIEVRRDPLTGATAITSSELLTKERMVFGKTDWDHSREHALRTREGCAFCPERVMDATPRFPEHVIEAVDCVAAVSSSSPTSSRWPLCTPSSRAQTCMSRGRASSRRTC